MDDNERILQKALDHALSNYINALKPFENHICWRFLKNLECFNVNYVSNKIHDINGINDYLIHTENIPPSFIENKPDLINKTELILILNCIIKATIDSIHEFSIKMIQCKTNYLILVQCAETCKIINQTFLLFRTMQNDALILKNKIISESSEINSYNKLKLMSM
jgi:hypothetical protein